MFSIVQEGEKQECWSRVESKVIDLKHALLSRVYTKKKIGINLIRNAGFFLNFIQTIEAIQNEDELIRLTYNGDICYVH